MSTADKLNALVQTKADIKQALIDKGQNPSDVFSSYADDIRAIETGGGVFDFASIGYTGDEEPLKSGLAYAKEIYDNWDLSETHYYFHNDKKLIIFPKIDTIGYNRLETLSFIQCTNLIVFPALDLSFTDGRLNNRMFEGCTSLQVLPQMDYSKWVTFSSLFKDCKNLESVGTIDCSSTHQLSKMFQGCEKLPYNPLVNVTNSLTSLDYLFQGCNSLLTLGDISNWNVSGVTAFDDVFEDCYKLTTIDISNWDMSNSTRMYSTFSGCVNLTELKIPYNIGAPGMGNTFKNCSSLTVLPPINTENVTYFMAPFEGCRKLVRIEGISVKSYGSISRSTIFPYANQSNTRYMLMKDIGTNENQTSISLPNILNWGVTDESDSLSAGARQSLIDSLITYSFDRATSGYSTCNISLASNTKALLTEDEIAQITAKGYTIA